MNVQTQIPGQISSQVPNQTGNQLPGLPQQNGNSFHTQAPVLGGQSNPAVMDPEVIRMRYFMREKIFEMLMRRQTQPTDMVSKRIQDISRRLEEGLFKLASTKEEYLNMNTLESRLQAFIKRAPQNHQAPQTNFMNTSTPVGTMIPTPGTMIPTPGMNLSGNSNMMVSSVVDPSIISTSGTMSSSVLNSGSMIPNANGSFPTMHGGSFHAAEGSLSNNIQQSPSSFSVNSSGNNLMASMRPSSQMIPTPGFNSNSTHSVMNVENTSNGGMFSSIDSSVVPQQVPQKAGGQNSRLLQNVGGVFGSGVRALMQQRFQNGSMNSGYGNSPQIFNGSSSSVSASRPLQQPLGQHQRPVMQGDGNRFGTAVSTEITSLSNPGAPVGSMIDNQNINLARPSSVNGSNLLVNSQSNMPADPLRPQLAEQIEKLDFQPTPSSRDDRSQSSMMQYQQTQDLLQQPKQEFGACRQQTHLSQQQQAFVKNNVFAQSQMESNIGIQLKSEPGLVHQNEALQPKVTSGQLQYSELHNNFQQNINGNQSRNSQFSSLSSVSQGMCTPNLQNTKQMMSDMAKMEYNIQPESLLNSQWHSESDGSSLAGNLSRGQNLHEDLHQRIVGNGEAQRNNLSCEVTGQTVASRNTMDQSKAVVSACTSGNAIRERQFRNQQRWLLFLRHARHCKSPEGTCPERNCHIVQTLVKHIDGCNTASCSYPRCYHSKRIVHHYKNCRDTSCPVCIPVRNFIRTRSKQCVRPDSKSGFSGLVDGSHRSTEAAVAGPKDTPKPSEIVVETSENPHPSVKRLKVERPTESIMAESGGMLLPETDSTLNDSQDVLVKEDERNDNYSQFKSELPDVKTEISCGSIQSATEVNNIAIDSSFNQMKDSGPIVKNDFSSSAKEELMKDEKDGGEVKAEEVVQPSESGVGTKSGKPMIKGVSLTELFTPEQIREHIASLRQWVGQSKAKVEKIQALEHSMSENSCQLCAVEKLTFDPPPIYCSPCGARIKRNAMYYTGGAGETRHYFCIPCYNEARGDTISVDGATVSKSRLEKKKNDEETEEWWVQCDKCEAWQHQICALFNGRRNDGGQAEYTCPNCYIDEIERGERTPLPQSALLGAKDLPRTILSDHIEQRLSRRLRLERQERARLQGKSYDEVPGAEGIVVRVVSSVDKKLEVKPRFLEIFREENYPTEFPYKSKVVLLFQKIEGVEVCLFGMYVQEFGSECQQPNQRRVYLSYLDSVKYFRPDVKTVTGEALRTFVYHEILIGYLEYCKLRGFTSCYIWACPPLKGEDYILYCHPEIQKTPKSDKLREWYLSMLRKATKENIVVDLTNLYDHFFIQTGECKAKVTAARLPYFDGDYWPGAAEDMIYQIYQEEECRKQNKKGTTKKMFTKRALKASGQSDLSTNASKDILLMHKLGETILPMKEDFIMVHLQHACTHCCLLMVSGNRWVCNQCKNFQLCDKCYDVEQKRDDRERHPINQKDKHALYRVEINDVPEDTKDKDDILESEFFDTRQAFLSLCQGNHYQYDTLRRAKHSSMMVLYHLHNPTAPAFVTTCNICHLDIETGQGWRCETCPDYDVCNTCYQKDGGIDHPHKLTNHPSLAERDAQNKEARQLRVLQLRKMLDLLVHASQCRSLQCQYPNCRKVKGLFRHGIHCRVRASGGCFLCKKMWYLLQLHARACKESQCHVPRCRDLKEHLRRLQQQSDSRRRAAVMEMMRQRAAEVANNN